MLSALTNVQHRPEQAFMMHRWTPVSLRQPFHPSPCVWSLLTRLYKKNQRGKQGMESGPYLPTPAPTVLSCSLPTDREDKDTPQWQSCCCHYVQSRQETQRSSGFQMWSKDHAAAESPGELLKMPITRLEYSSGVQDWPEFNS